VAATIRSVPQIGFGRKGISQRLDRHDVLPLLVFIMLTVVIPHLKTPTQIKRIDFFI